MRARLRRLFARLRGLGRGTNLDAEFEDELTLHLDLLTERYIHEGMTPADAARAARRQFGNATRLQETRLEMQTTPWIDALWRDARYGARQLWRTPSFTVAAMLSLGLGIGAATAVFTLLDQLVLRRLPVHDPERLVMIWPTGPPFGSNTGARTASYPMCHDFQRQAAAFDFVFCRFETPASITIDDRTERVSAELVSGNFFAALGVRPAVGRVLTSAADDRMYLGHPSVVLSYQYWTSRFASDPAIVGKKILVNGSPMEIVGVSAAGFAGLDPASSPAIRVPILMTPVMTPGRHDLANRRSQWIQMFARLKDGYSLESAAASVQPLFHQILQREVDSPALRGLSRLDRDRFLQRAALIDTAATGYSGLRLQYSTILILLMGMALVMLVIACTNVAGLLTARAVARQKEIAVRLAIGAGRGRLIRQLLIESLLLSGMGTVLGLILAFAATRALLDMVPSGGAVLILRANPDGRILLFGVVMALATGILFGVMPALQATTPALVPALKEMVGVAIGATGPARFRKGLVIAQVALSFVLLMAAGLFAGSLLNLRDMHTGIESTSSLVTFQVDPAKSGFDVARTRAFYSAALDQIRALPGVTAAAYTMWPLLNGHEWDLTVVVDGHTTAPGEDMQAYYNLLSPGYWQAMGIPLLRGRDFDAGDRVDGGDDPQPWTVAIVNRAFAEHYFGTADPIGRRIGCCHGPTTTPAIRIVGVVENALFAGPRSGVRRQVFLPYLESASPAAVSFYVRTTLPPASIVPTLGSVVRSLAGPLPIYEVKTLERQLDDTLTTDRMIAFLSGVFGLLAMALAALGLYGVMAFMVARRTREIGVRIALGASTRGVLRLVFREAAQLLCPGLLAGLALAYALRGAIAAQLFGVVPADPWITAAAAAVIVLVALAASLGPARRAAAIAPLTALRCE